MYRKAIIQSINQLMASHDDVIARGGLQWTEEIGLVRRVLRSMPNFFYNLTCVQDKISISNGMTIDHAIKIFLPFCSNWKNGVNAMVVPEFVCGRFWFGRCGLLCGRNWHSSIRRKKMCGRYMNVAEFVCGRFWFGRYGLWPIRYRPTILLDILSGLFRPDSPNGSFRNLRLLSGLFWQDKQLKPPVRCFGMTNSVCC